MRSDLVTLFESDYHRVAVHEAAGVGLLASFDDVADVWVESVHPVIGPHFESLRTADYSAACRAMASQGWVVDHDADPEGDGQRLADGSSVHPLTRC